MSNLKESWTSLHPRVSLYSHRLSSSHTSFVVLPISPVAYLAYLYVLPTKFIAYVDCLYYCAFIILPTKLIAYLLCLHNSLPTFFAYLLCLSPRLPTLMMTFLCCLHDPLPTAFFAYLRYHLAGFASLSCIANRAHKAG